MSMGAPARSDEEHRVEDPLPDVTAIIICHNVRDEVLTCLAALHAHAGPLDVEIVVVDNASTDGTVEAVNGAHPECQTIRLSRNEGLPARNHGLRRARGRYRMFIDSDAVLRPGALPTLLGVLEEDPRIGLVGPRLVYPDGRLQLSTRRYPPLLLPILRRPPLERFFEHGATIRRHLMADDSHDSRRPVEYVIGACQVFSADAQRAAGEIDRHIWFGHDDADWCFRIRSAGYDVVYVPEAETVHDYRRTSARNPVSIFALRQLAAHAYFQWKWRGARRRLIEEGHRMDVEASPRVAARAASMTCSS
jgi:N-acetylglucosaminyl-diphospho-decaprenol L-rhamnosyltransferase